MALFAASILAAPRPIGDLTESRRRAGYV